VFWDILIVIYLMCMGKVFCVVSVSAKDVQDSVK